MIKINRDSIILKIVFYNTIMIILTSLTIAIIIMTITFKEMEETLSKKATNKSIVAEKAFVSYVNEIENAIEEGIRIKRSQLRKGEYKSNLEKVIVALEENPALLELIDVNQIELGLLDDKGTPLAYTGNSKFLSSRIFLAEENQKKIIKKKYFFLKDIDKNMIYTQLIISYIREDEQYYILCSFPITGKVLSYIREYIRLSKGDKIFLLHGKTYLDKDISQEIEETQLIRLRSSEDKNYSYIDAELAGEKYYIGRTILESIINNENIGYFGVGISREETSQVRAIITILVSIMIACLILTSLTLSNWIYKKLLKPLEIISDVAKRISNGDYNTKISSNGMGEIRVLETSLKGMLEKLDKNQKTLSFKNKKLRENLRRINVIEDLILDIYSEDDVAQTVKKIIKTFISDKGLGYTRGMFFRYSRERDALIGEYSCYNPHIIDEKSDILKEQKNGFEFQVKQLNDVIRLINIPFSSDNFISNCLRNREISFVNDKGYRNNLGNDLFNGLGLNNYIVIPIYNIDYYSGVILFDYYTKENLVSAEDAELIKILMLNVTTKLKNKLEQEERIEEERNRTINEVADRFLNAREEALEKLSNIVNKNVDGDIETLKTEIKQILDSVKHVQDSKEILKKYSNPLDRKIIERVNIEILMIDMISELKLKIKEDGNEDKVLISSFISYSGDVIGNNQRLKRAFGELLRNAYDAVMANNKATKKINITVIKDKISNKIKIDIKDNGIGMTEEQLKYIFQPFITYKKNSTGLGIPLASRVIKDCKGVIKVYSEEGKGTEIKITLNIFKEEK